MNFIRERKWIIHLIFWIVIYIVYIVQPLFSGEEQVAAVKSISYAVALKALFHLLGVVATSYFFCKAVIPLLLEKKRMVIGMVILMPGLCLIAILNRISVVYLLEPILGYNSGQETVLQILSQFKVLFHYYVISNIVGAFPFVIFYLLLDRQLILRKQAQVEHEKKEAELAALKSQLNPHFLFNTLNNIYSLAVQNSPQTPSCIEKLAHILDYLLYRCNDKLVPLEKEIDLLKNYFDLQKIRFGDRLDLKTVYKTDRSYKIAPLLLLPIVENIFKHGVEQNTGSTDVIVLLNGDNNKLTFSTENVYNPDACSSSGIGLTNMKQQLELLYSGKHNFEITKRNQYFITTLQLELE